jgi:hypothetical protein
MYSNWSSLKEPNDAGGEDYGHFWVMVLEMIIQNIGQI